MMQTLIDYFKSKIGILKICGVLLVALVVSLCVYSHFNSHWILHNSLINDYEDCLVNNPVSTGEGRAGTTYIIEEGRGEHLIASHLGPESKLFCPSPAWEIVLVSTAISVLLLSVLFLLLLCKLPKPIVPKLWCQLKYFEIVFHSFSAFFLLLGGILFICSAYFIAAWCDLKAIRSHPRPRMHHDDIAVVRTVDVEADKGDTGELADGSKVLVPAPHHQLVVPSLSIPQQQSGDSLGGGKGGDGRFDDEEFCNIRVLTIEKYCAGAIAIAAALLYAIIANLIYRFAKQNKVSCSSGPATRVSQSESQQTENRRDSSKRKCNKCDLTENKADQNQNEDTKPNDMRDNSTGGGKIKVDTGV